MRGHVGVGGGVLLFSPTAWAGSGGPGEEGHTQRNTQELFACDDAFSAGSAPLQKVRCPHLIFATTHSATYCAMLARYLPLKMGEEFAEPSCKTPKVLQNSGGGEGEPGPVYPSFEELLFFFPCNRKMRSERAERGFRFPDFAPFSLAHSQKQFLSGGFCLFLPKRKKKHERA